MTRLKVQKAEPLRLEYENVVAALLNDIAPIVSGEDGLAVLKVVLQLTGAIDKEAVRKQEAEVALEVGAEVGA